MPLSSEGVSGYRISAELREQYGVNISKSAIYHHRRNCVLLPRQNSVYSLRYETGNRRLARAIEITRKLTRTHQYCRCDSAIQRSLRKRGLVWICSLCGGWIPYNLGYILKKRFKRPQEIQHKLVATGRTY